MNKSTEERIYSVGEVNRMADLLLQEFILWVEGEVSNLRPYPNYTFFSLTDEEAVLPCIIFRDVAPESAEALREGMGVLVRGRLGIYVKRGQYRMNVYEIQEAGEGRLRREFFRLLRKLSAEGLFDQRLKRPLPPYPERVGLITSLEGAAVRDVVVNLTRRYPCCRLLIRGVRVQGEEACKDIVSAIELFNRACPVDVLILARGGGSLEDLQPFNTEEVVRAIRSSSIPVITGVGHEPDLTLADLAADLRASTPTGAAEAAVPSSSEVLSLLRMKESALATALSKALRRWDSALASIITRRPFHDGEVILGAARQRLAEAETLLINRTRGDLENRRRRLEEQASALRRFPREYRDLPARIERDWKNMVFASRSFLRWKGREPSYFARELVSGVRALLAGQERRAGLAASRLDALSPLAVLSRGYAIVTRKGETRPILNSREVERGDEVDVRVHRGRIFCEVRGREVETGGDEEVLERSG